MHVRMRDLLPACSLRWPALTLYPPPHTHTHRFDEHHPVNFTLASALGTATPDVAALEAFAPKVRSAPPLRSSL